MMLVPESRARSLTASGPKAENSGPAMPPILTMPSIAMYNSDVRSRYTKMRSPFLAPSSIRPLANRLVMADISPKVYFCTSPAAVIEYRAILFFLQLRACRSIAS